MVELLVSEVYLGVSPDVMWDRIGDPAALAAWHPGVESTELVDGGRARVNLVAGGARVVETILDRGDRHYTFEITESPLPLGHFVSTVGVRRDGNGACIVEWKATFEPKGVTEREASDVVRAFFRAGLDALAHEYRSSSRDGVGSGS